MARGTTTTNPTPAKNLEKVTTPAKDANAPTVPVNDIPTAPTEETFKVKEEPTPETQEQNQKQRQAQKQQQQQSLNQELSGEMTQENGDQNDNRQQTEGDQIDDRTQTEGDQNDNRTQENGDINDNREQTEGEQVMTDDRTITEGEQSDNRNLTEGDIADERQQTEGDQIDDRTQNNGDIKDERTQTEGDQNDNREQTEGEQVMTDERQQTEGDQIDDRTQNNGDIKDERTQTEGDQNDNRQQTEGDQIDDRTQNNGDIKDERTQTEGDQNDNRTQENGDIKDDRQINESELGDDNRQINESELGDDNRTMTEGDIADKRQQTEGDMNDNRQMGDFSGSVVGGKGGHAESNNNLENVGNVNVTFEDGAFKFDLDGLGEAVTADRAADTETMRMVMDYIKQDRELDATETKEFIDTLKEQNQAALAAKDKEIEELKTMLQNEYEDRKDERHTESEDRKDERETESEDRKDERHTEAEDRKSERETELKKRIAELEAQKEVLISDNETLKTVVDKITKAEQNPGTPTSITIINENNNQQKQQNNNNQTQAGDNTQPTNQKPEPKPKNPDPKPDITGNEKKSDTVPDKKETDKKTDKKTTPPAPKPDPENEKTPDPDDKKLYTETIEGTKSSTHQFFQGLINVAAVHFHLNVSGIAEKLGVKDDLEKDGYILDREKIIEMQKTSEKDATYTNAMLKEGYEYQAGGSFKVNGVSMSEETYDKTAKENMTRLLRYEDKEQFNKLSDTKKAEEAEWATKFKESHSYSYVYTDDQLKDFGEAGLNGLKDREGKLMDEVANAYAQKDFDEKRASIKSHEDQAKKYAEAGQSTARYHEDNAARETFSKIEKYGAGEGQGTARSEAYRAGGKSAEANVLRYDYVQNYSEHIKENLKIGFGDVSKIQHNEQESENALNGYVGKYVVDTAKLHQQASKEVEGKNVELESTWKMTSTANDVKTLYNKSVENAQKITDGGYRINSVTGDLTQEQEDKIKNDNNKAIAEKRGAQADATLGTGDTTPPAPTAEKNAQDYGM